MLTQVPLLLGLCVIQDSVIGVYTPLPSSSSPVTSDVKINSTISGQRVITAIVKDSPTTPAAAAAVAMATDRPFTRAAKRASCKCYQFIASCFSHTSTGYWMDYCMPISDVPSRHVRSVRRHYLVVPRHSLSSYGRQAFAVAGPTAWNSLSDDLRDPMLITDSFRCLLTTRLFSEY